MPFTFNSLQYVKEYNNDRNLTKQKCLKTVFPSSNEVKIKVKTDDIPKRRNQPYLTLLCRKVQAEGKLELLETTYINYHINLIWEEPIKNVGNDGKTLPGT